MSTSLRSSPARVFWPTSVCMAIAALGTACAPVEANAGHPPLPAAPALALSAADASRLGWLEGHWAGTQDGTEMEELWTSASGGAMLGMHKDVKSGRMTSFEFLRIERSPQGLVYLASPRGAAVTPFALVDATHERAVFENKNHDFPQRILYWLDSSGALHARVEGILRGAPESEEWTWKRK